MERRELLAALLSLPATCLIGWRVASYASQRQSPSRVANTVTPAARSIHLAASGPVVSRADGEIIENLDITSRAGNALSLQHNGVTVRHCRIRHAGGHGIDATGASNLLLHDLEIEHIGAARSGANASPDRDNIHLDDCRNPTLSRIKASRGSANIYLVGSSGAHISSVELKDARGPSPRGQNIQLNESPSSTLEDFSAENDSRSWTEDNISIFKSNGCIVRRGLVSYNNSPSGDGVMLEASFDCLVEDVDAVQQGNGAFAAVPLDRWGSGGCAFVRCRTRDSYNTPRDGRAAPSSNGLAIYTRISTGAPRHRIVDCHYAALANPHNLIWQLKAVEPNWSFTARDFVPRAPLRLKFGW